MYLIVGDVCFFNAQDSDRGWAAMGNAGGNYPGSPPEHAAGGPNPFQVAWCASKLCPPFRNMKLA